MQDRVNQIYCGDNQKCVKIDNAALYNQDCLEFLKGIETKSINLVLIDPPYNINHNAKWDKWKQQQDYIKWLGSVFLECERILKDNGSFYFWHNDFKQMAELQHYIAKNTRFVFKSMISWIKPNFRSISWKNKKEDANLRSWFNIQEYCLYYTFEDNGTIPSKIKEYMKNELNKSGFTKTQLDNIWWKNGWTGTEKSKKASNIMCHFFGNNKQINMPTKENYEKLQTTGFFQKPYEELRAEYEELRPCFNIESGQDYNNVWYSAINNGNNSNKIHSCEKPQDLLQKIILTSSNEGDVVLDCFAGSFSTAIASLRTNRQFIGCERDKTYFDNSIERLKNWREDLQDIQEENNNQPTLFD